MASRKRDLEIIYNLQWKNKPANGGDKTSVIGVYDIPATTLNWEMFKSYLLKNSGTTGDDVIVSYCTDNGKEYPIQSQTDFQVALYAFRNKARNGEIINLKLDRISDQKSANRHSNDVETQFDNNESMVSTTCCGGSENPPDWFLSFMAQFKKEINEEVTATVSSVLSSALGDLNKPSALGDVNKPQPQPVVLPTPRVFFSRSRSKSDSKKMTKLQPLLAEGNAELSHKQLLKSYKFECKLQKLENRIARYKEKRLALFQSKLGDNEPGASKPSKGHHGHKKDKESRHRREQEKHQLKPVDIPKPEKPKEKSTTKDSKEEPLVPKKVTLESDNDGKMDAAPVNSQNIVPHMLGGEVYLHQWEVVNTGTAPWTSKTSLQFTWGSKALVPLDDVISVPYLKPGDKGSLAVRLQIPKESGTYECYWHFMHKGRRFGRWLGCQVVVDPFDLKGNNSVLETSTKMVDNYFTILQHDTEQTSNNEKFLEYVRAKCSAAPSYEKPVKDNEFESPEIPRRNEDKDNETDCNKSLHEWLMRRIPAGKEELQQDSSDTDCSTIADVKNLKLYEPLDKNCSSDSDNQSIASLSDSSVSSKGSREEFVVVPVPDCFLLDKSNEEAAEKPVHTLVPQTSASSTSCVKIISDILIEGPKPKKIEDTVSKGPVLKEEHVAKASFQREEEACDDNNNSEDNVKRRQIGDNNKREVGRDSTEKDMVFISVPKDEEGGDDAGYIYVYVDGQKIPIPKKLFKSEYLPKSSSTPSNTPKSTSATGNSSGVHTPVSENAPSSSSTVIFTETEPQRNSAAPTAPKEEEGYMSDATNYLSHCSAAGSSFSDANNQFEAELESSSRLFIFPQNRPGYEVVQPESHRRESEILTEAGKNKKDERCNFSDNVKFETDPKSSLRLFVFPENRPGYEVTQPESRNSRQSKALTEAVEAVNLMSNPPQSEAQASASANATSAEIHSGTEQARPVHILPENLVSGAVNVASSAISTARSVINMIAAPREQPGHWVDGHWVSTKPETPREANLNALAEMGFWNRDLNATLLARYNDDLQRVVAELVQ